jgi:hypothetical protein
LSAGVEIAAELPPFLRNLALDISIRFGMGMPVNQKNAQPPSPIQNAEIDDHPSQARERIAERGLIAFDSLGFTPIPPWHFTSSWPHLSFIQDPSPIPQPPIPSFSSPTSRLHISATNGLIWFDPLEFTHRQGNLAVACPRGFKRLDDPKSSNDLPFLLLLPFDRLRALSKRSVSKRRLFAALPHSVLFGLIHFDSVAPAAIPPRLFTQRLPQKLLGSL